MDEWINPLRPPHPGGSPREGEWDAMVSAPERRPLHIRAEPSDIAERVLAVGDPGRAKLIAGMLDEARLVNDHRGLIIYTGEWRGVEVTVATHGIGGPSSLIVFEELAALGTRAIVRLGTCGSLRKNIGLGDVIVAPGAGYVCGGAGLSGYSHLSCLPATADPELTLRIVSELSRTLVDGGQQLHLAPVVTSDSFYAEDDNFAKQWSSFGAAAVEMECASLLSLSWMRGFRAACVLIVSDIVGPGFPSIGGENLAGIVKRVAPAVLNALASIGGVDR